ncbi:MAG: lytic transglycosylase domain-containing protein [Myxococcales bacterium]|nr:MAG: lytic transglycosylase domain-containing protein [Myxococcales bacterium]
MAKRFVTLNLVTRLIKQSVCLFTVAIIVLPTAQADIFKRVDGDGVVHFTNVKPRGKGSWDRVVKGGGSSKSRAARPYRGPSVSKQENSPERFHRYDQYISEAAMFYRLPESFIRAVMTVESNFHFDVVSHAGAMGLMQLMPGTASRMGVRDPFKPRQNILGGARYLRILANQFNGDMVLTIAAYNAGENAVLKYGGIPPYEETRRYVNRVLVHYYNYQRQNSGTKLALR